MLPSVPTPDTDSPHEAFEVRLRPLGRYLGLSMLMYFPVLAIDSGNTRASLKGQEGVDMDRPKDICTRLLRLDCSQGLKLRSLSHRGQTYHLPA